MASWRKTQAQIVNFQDLAIWRTKLPDVDFAVLPPCNNRPNPLATQDRLYVSVFSSGAICALERDAGKLVWRRELPRLADSSVQLYEGRLFAKTAQALFALHPDSGEALWSFSPYGSDGEFLYSAPSLHDNRVYIGDRKGLLHCLDAKSGETIWKRLTSSARNNDVNSTPVIVDGLVIVSTNAKIAIAYDASSGKVAWKQKLESPSVFGPVAHQDSVLAVADSLYALNPRTGKVRRRFAWKGEKVYQADSALHNVVVTFAPRPANLRLAPDKAAAEKSLALHPHYTTLTFMARSGKQRTRRVLASCAALRYAPASRLVYLSHLRGLDLFRPATGTLIAQLKLKDDSRGGIALIDVKDNRIYALIGDGSVYALQHP